MRTIIIGDVHGCYDELNQLLVHELRFQREDRVILLGDLVDRGPKSHEVLRFAEAFKFEVILGNHDEKHLRYHTHEQKVKAYPTYRNPMRPFTGHHLEVHKSLTQEDFNFIRTFKPFIRISDKFVAVHGGLLNGVKVEDQDQRDMIRRRHIYTETGRSATLVPDTHQPPIGSAFWADIYKGPDFVFYGHHVHGLEDVHHTSNAVGLDTGACFGGRLSAAIIENGIWADVVQVESEEYQEFAAWRQNGRD